MRALVILVALMVSAGCFAAPGHRLRDGNWWAMQSKSDQIAYLTGFLDGISLGGHLVQIDGNAQSQKAARESVRKHANALIGVQVSQFQAGLAKFYKDSRNRRISLADAVFIVAQTVKGKSPDEIERISQLFRETTPPQR